jgi:hypothetical protein
VRDGPKDFSLHLDGIYAKSYEHSYQAEHDGRVWLDEQAQQLAAQLADEQAQQQAQADEDTPIGTIHGYTVYGARFNEPGEDCHGQLYKWSLDWNGKTISVYDDSQALNIHTTGPVSCMGDIDWDDWQWMRALAQTDLVEQLIALAHGEGRPPILPTPAAPIVSRRHAAATMRRPPGSGRSAAEAPCLEAPA